MSQDENSGATDGSGAPAPEAAAGSCTTDSDCVARASYCETSPCTCEIAAKRDPAPDCGGGTVNCFADPCMNRKAVCDQGHCALADSK